MDSQSTESIHINSENSFLSYGMSMKVLKAALRDEFTFYDNRYFAHRTKAGLKWHFTGHGLKLGLMPLSKTHDMQYSTLIEEVVTMAEDKRKKLTEI